MLAACSPKTMTDQETADEFKSAMLKWKVVTDSVGSIPDGVTGKAYILQSNKMMQKGIRPIRSRLDTLVPSKTFAGIHFATIKFLRAQEEFAADMVRMVNESASKGEVKRRMQKLDREFILAMEQLATELEKLGISAKDVRSEIAEYSNID